MLTLTVTFRTDYPEQLLRKLKERETKRLLGYDGLHGEAVITVINVRISLSRCPFCGEKAELYYISQKNSFVVRCLACKAQGPESPNKEQATVKWNISKDIHFGH
jgi:hypothetical protein